MTDVILGIAIGWIVGGPTGAAIRAIIGCVTWAFAEVML